MTANPNKPKRKTVGERSSPMTTDKARAEAEAIVQRFASGDEFSTALTDSTTQDELASAIAVALTARDAEAEGLRAELAHTEAQRCALLTSFNAVCGKLWDAIGHDRHTEDGKDCSDIILADLARARKERDALAVEAGGLREVMRDVEWIRTYDESSIQSVERCPFCFHQKRDGHEPKCLIRAALRKVSAITTCANLHEAEGLREAVRVLAKFIYENGRGCGTRTATERDDDMKIHRGNLYANPIAKAAIDAAGGGE